VVLPEHVTLADVLATIGIEFAADRVAVLDDDGHRLDPALPAERLDDGAALSIVDLVVAAPAADRTRAAGAPAVAPLPASIGWLLAALGLILAAINLLVPDAIDPVMRVTLVALSGGGAVAGAALWALRARSPQPSAAPVLGALVLAFAAGTLAVPRLPAASSQASVFIGLAFAAVLAVLLSVLLSQPVPRAQTGVAAIVLSSLAVLWGLAIVLDVATWAPASVALGAVPVVLRALPNMLLDVPPGAFIDFDRFQSLRTSVRETLPTSVLTVSTDAAHALVDRAVARLVTATLLLCGLAAAAAPWALVAAGADDPIMRAGRLGLGCCVVIALVLGSRRSSDPLLQWVPRVAAAIIAGVGLWNIAPHTGAFVLTIAAGVALIAGIGAGFIVVPAGRGASSLFWSRLGDAIEGTAVVLAVPAGLLSAGIIEILRGVMA